MTRIGYIFWREYWGHITRRSYLFFTLGFPLFMMSVPLMGGLILFLAIRAALPPTDPRPIGLIDPAGVLADTSSDPTYPVEVRRFAHPQEAAMALTNDEIQAYYEVQSDYWATGEVILTYEVAPSEAVDRMVTQWVQAQVRAEAPPDMLARLDGGATIIHRDLAGRRGYSLDNMIEVAIVYLLIYFMRLGGSFTAEYMFSSIAGEASDRTLEILLTSVSPLQFIMGKLGGLLAVGLTQLGLWGGVVVALSLASSALLGFDLVGFLLNWEHLGLLISALVAAYVLDQILAAALGLLRVSGGAGSLLFSTFNSIMGLGLLYAAYFVPRNLHTPVAIAASLFPLTAPLVLLVRVVVSEVPLWQIGLSQTLLWGSSIAGVFWLRRLLRANLVASATPFSLRYWLKQKVRGN